MSTLRLGIDLGGTKIEGIALDRRPRTARRASTRRATTTPATIDAIASMVESLERQAGGRARSALAFPGPLAPTRVS